MPAPRLPWFKFWPEAMDHEKVALLSDGEFRTWLAVLADGSRQPTRWRFASAQHAAVVTHRPVEHITALIEARLLDEQPDGLWIHDWRQWQGDGTEVGALRRAWQKIAGGVRPLIFARDGHRCVFCGACDPLEVDHVTALKNGGSNDIWNLQTLCRPCNRRKAAR